ncbi:MAG: cytochrome c3 family protein [Candidatus Aminicenantes bacterium]|nr:cytochrome c3 family protein [Candidatus Aminicenantes bacterium]
MNVRTLIRSGLLAIGLVIWIASAGLAAGDEDCLTCHGDKDLKSARGQSMFLDSDKFQASVHGQAEIACTDCHADLRKVKDFPHAEKLKPVDCSACHDQEAALIKSSVHMQPHRTENPIVVTCADCHGTHDIRKRDDTESSVFSINIPETCDRCHLERVKIKNGGAFILQYQQSAHYKALQKAGLSLSANCVTCHGGHDVKAAGDPLSRVSRKSIIKTCCRCHVGIEKDYLEGVHGKDFVRGVKDVPVCNDCHSEHGIISPTDISSRVYATKVAAVCSRCHDDESLGRQYGFLTSRLKTYSASYHGTASKFGETRVANCASCHGFHDIRTSSDPKSPINAANLAATCGQCHPGAGVNFAKGKIHVVSAKTENQGSHVAKIIYIIIIGGLISVFLLFIAADLFHRIRTRWTKA